MDKIEYGDVNRFLVSFGLLLIAISLAVPYFFLKEDFGLYRTAKEITEMPALVQAFFSRKQGQVMVMQGIVPFVSLLLFIIGGLCSGIGLKRWFHRQKQIDKKFDRELDKLDLEIRSMTTSEVIEKIQGEVQEAALENGDLPQSNPESASPVLNYLKVEERIYKRFLTEIPEDLKIQTQLVYGSVQIDMLISSPTGRMPDRLFEIKYFKGNYNVTTILKALNQLNKLTNYYHSRSRRTAVPVLIIVFEEHVINRAQVPDLANQIFQAREDFPVLSALRVAFIGFNEIETFDVSSLLGYSIGGGN